jgi:hypothetical protein
LAVHFVDDGGGVGQAWAFKCCALRGREPLLLLGKGRLACCLEGGAILQQLAEEVQRG